MKKNIVTALILATLGLAAQEPVLHWKFDNPIVINQGSQAALQFDVVISCSEPFTYACDLMLYFTYNTAAFGSNIVAGGGLTYEKLTLLQANVGGQMVYNLYGPSGNDTTVGFLVETSLMGPPPYGWDIPQYPVNIGLLRVQMKIADTTQPAGIKFCEDLMNGAQYYIDATHPVATKYGIPLDYACIYDNDLLDFPLQPPPHPDLYWRFANVHVENDTFYCDVQAKCSVKGTYHQNSLLSFSYNPLVFGPKIMANGNITIERLELLGENISGTYKYAIINSADYKPNVFALIVEPNFVGPTLDFFTEVDTAWKGYLGLQIALQNTSNSNWGMFFYPDLMDCVQTYIDENFGSGTYGDNPPVCTNIYVNNLAGFTPCAMLEGHVKDDLTAQPLGSYIVSTGEIAAYSDYTGYYSMIMPCGNFDVTADGHCHYPETTSVNIFNAPSIVQDFDLAEDPYGTGYIKGKVYDENLDPLEGAIVQVGDSVCVTDSIGYYFLEIINGSWLMTVTAGGFDPYEYSFDLGCNQWKNWNVYLTLLSGTLEGTITDCNTGMAIEGAEISVAGMSAYTNQAGQYTLPGIPPGTWQVVVSSPGYYPHEIAAIIISGQTTALDGCLSQLLPVDLQYEVDETTLILHWADPAPGEVLGFKIYRNNVLTDSIADTTITYSGLTGYHEYCVSACYPLGESFRDCENIATGISKPPLNLELNYGGVGLYVPMSWDPPEWTGEYINWYDPASAGGNAIGLTSPGTFLASARWEPADLASYSEAYLQQVNFFWNDDAPQSEFTIKVWKGPDASILLLEQEVEDPNVGGWNEVALDSVVQIDATQELWIGYSVTNTLGSHPAATDLGPAVPFKGDMISLDGSIWESMSTVYGLNYNWAIEGFVSFFTAGAPATLQRPASPLPSIDDPGFEARPNPLFSPRSDGGNSPFLEGYNIYRQIMTYPYELVGTTGPEITEFVDVLPYIPHDANWYVTAQYTYGESGPSNYVWMIWCGEEEKPETGITVFPVPASGWINVVAEEELKRISLFSMNGLRLYESENMDGNKVRIVVSGYEPGMYYLKVQTRSRIFSTKVVISNGE